MTRRQPQPYPAAQCKHTWISKSRSPSSRRASPSCGKRRTSGELDLDAEIGRLEAKSAKLLRDTYSKLTPWQKAQVARHPERPHFKDYVAGLASDFVPLAGDRAFADDPAILGGLATIDGRQVMLIGHEKGDDTASRLRHNFGMAKPEGYRKAIRLMRLATGSGFRSSAWSIRRAPFPASRPRSAGRRKRSPARPRNASRSRCR